MVLDWIMIFVIPATVIMMYVATKKFFSSRVKSLLVALIFSYIFFGISKALVIINHFVIGIENYYTTNYQSITAIEYIVIIGALLFTMPERCAYVTNHLKEVRAAKMAGMRVVYVGKVKKGVEGDWDIRINELDELVGLFASPDPYEPQEVKVRDR